MRSFGCTPSGVVTRSCTLGHTTSDYSGDLVRDHRILEGPHLEMHGQCCKLFMFRVISFFLFSPSPKESRGNKYTTAQV